MMINLIQPRELFGPEERRQELMTCWERNAHLFDMYMLPDGRPTFDDLFAACQPGMVNVIANSDIYFDAEGVEFMRTINPGICFALSRWDVLPDGTARHYAHKDSQDAWVVFGRPARIDAPYTMGVPGCDNALAHALHMAGLCVYNPSLTIKAYHLHNVDFRGYGEGRGRPKMYRVPPPYKLIPPTEL